jgi:hypothetical protein
MLLQKVQPHPTRDDLYLEEGISDEISKEEKTIVKEVLQEELGCSNTLAFYVSLYASCK